MYVVDSDTLNRGSLMYVVDSDTLIHLFNHYYLKRFPSLWSKFDDLIESESIISVSEVFKEIGNHGDRLAEWAKSEKKRTFTNPSPEELAFVPEIFKIPHFQQLINRKSLLVGKPVADPFIVARAKIQDRCVITQEKNTPNAAKIPNVCAHFEIGCVNLKGFMEKEGWEF